MNTMALQRTISLLEESYHPGGGFPDEHVRFPHESGWIGNLCLDCQAVSPTIIPGNNRRPSNRVQKYVEEARRCKCSTCNASDIKWRRIVGLDELCVSCDA